MNDEMFEKLYKKYAFDDMIASEIMTFFKENPYEFAIKCKGTFVDNTVHKNLKYILI